MKEAKKIKLFNKVVLTIDGEREELDSMPELWKALNWDIDNEDQAKECANIITKELICYGMINISALTQYEHKVFVSWE